jgi:hypothetical protein
MRIFSVQQAPLTVDAHCCFDILSQQSAATIESGGRSDQTFHIPVRSVVLFVEFRRPEATDGVMRSAFGRPNLGYLLIVAAPAEHTTSS